MVFTFMSQLCWTYLSYLLSLVFNSSCTNVCVFAHTVHCLGYNEELINRVFPPVPWAGGWSSQAELSPNTHQHRHTQWQEPMQQSLFNQAGRAPKGGCSRSGLRPGPRRKRWRWESSPPTSRTKFSHGIWVLHRHPKSIGCAYWLGFGQPEGKMRLDLSLTYAGEQRGAALNKHLHFICWAQSLRANLSQHARQISPWASEHIFLVWHLLW